MCYLVLGTRYFDVMQTLMEVNQGHFEDQEVFWPAYSWYFCESG